MKSRLNCRIRSVLALTAGAAALCPSASKADAPTLKEHVVVTARFGPAAGNFGPTGIESSKKRVRLVSCFAVGPSHIVVHDRLKRDVKVFTHTGALAKAIKLEVPARASSDTVRARDLALDGETMYVMVDDQREGTRGLPTSIRIAVFDVTTGICRDVRSLDSNVLTPPSGKAPMRGADALLLHADGTSLWLVDSIRQLSYEIVFMSPGARLAELPVAGWGGEVRVRVDDYASAVNLLDALGKPQRRLPETGALIAVSETGSSFALLQTLVIEGKTDWAISIFNSKGDRLAIVPKPKRSWRPFHAPVLERKYELVDTPAGAELYELYANAEGVRVVRWSR